MKLTKIKIEKIANEIMMFLKENNLSEDVVIYFNNKKINQDGIQEGCFNPKEYFEWAAEKHILSMSFEGELYRLINYDGGEILEDFVSIFAKHGIYYELGDSWNLTCYLLNDNIDVEYTFYEHKPEPIRIYQINQDNIPMEINKIIWAWKDLQDKVGDIGSCVVGAGFQFKYNCQEYFMTPCSRYQGSISWETNKDDIKLMLMQIGAVNVVYNWGVMD